MERIEPVELTVLCVVRDGTRILLQNRRKADWQGFAPPGGHVEPGESVVQAVIREMEEETGLAVRPKLCGVKQFPLEQGGRYLVFLFLADEFTGTLRSSTEGEMVWIERDRLGEYPTVSDLPELLAVMEGEDLWEFQYVIENGDWLVKLY